MATPPKLLKKLLRDIVHDRHINTSELRECVKHVRIEERVSSLKNVRRIQSGNTALHSSANKGFLEIIECLLDSLSNDQMWFLFEIQNGSAYTALHLAVLSGHSKVVEHLAVRMSPEQKLILLTTERAGDPNTILHNAIGHINVRVDTVRCLLADFTTDQKLQLIKVQDKDGHTVLHKAVNDIDTVRCLLTDFTTDQILQVITAQNSEGYAVLHTAAIGGHTETVQLLLKDISFEQKLNLIKILDKTNCTVLHAAAKKSQDFTVKYLLEGMTPEQRIHFLSLQDNEHYTFLQAAVQYLLADTVELLLHNVPVDERIRLLSLRKDGSHMTAVSVSILCQAPNREKLECLLRQVTAESKYELLKEGHGKYTALHHASQKENHAFIEVLLDDLSEEQRFDLLKMQTSWSGYTPMHYAAYYGRTDTLKCMTNSLHPDHLRRLLTICDDKNKIAYSVAVRQKHESTAEYLYSLHKRKSTNKTPKPKVPKLKVLETPFPSGNSQEVQPDEGRTLGFGAYGEVFLYRDRENNRKLAVKKIKVGNGGTNKIHLEANSAMKEVNTMRELDHERIVKYIHSERESIYLCIYMEYMPGGSVQDELQKTGAFKEGITKKYTRQLLEGLAYLHGRKILHRDIKGSNILCDGHGNIKLTDFGVSKQLETIQTLKGETLGEKMSTQGTANWMAPEVIIGERYGRRADVWSTGATVVEMLTTKPPWSKYKRQPTVIFYIATTKSADYQLDPTVSNAAREFLSLTFTPEKRQRPTVEELLQHAWMRD